MGKTAEKELQVGDLIIPRPPLKQVPGIILQVVDINSVEQDLKVFFSGEDNQVVWISSLDVELLKYKKVNTNKADIKKK